MDLALFRLNGYFIYIYFAYGLALFTLGFAVALAPKPKIPGLAVTWPELAGLALAHGGAEWAHFFELIEPPLPEFIHTLLLVVSGYLLIEFSSRILITLDFKLHWIRWLRWILPLILGIAVMAANAWMLTPDPIINIEVWTRAVFYVPGSGLAAWAFFKLGSLPQTRSKSPHWDTQGIAVLFVLSGLTYVLSMPISLRWGAQELDLALWALLLVSFRVFITIGIVILFILLFHSLELKRATELANMQEAALAAHRQARDIAEKQSEALARQAAQSEVRYRYLFEHVNDILLIYDFAGNLLEVNQIACQRLGYSRGELLQMRIHKVGAGQAEASAPSTLPAGSEEATFILYESRYECRDGTVIPVEINARIIEYDGRTAVLSVARDISERKKAEAEINRRNAELDALYHQATERANRISVSNEIIRTVSSARPLDEIFQAFAEQTRKLVAYDRMSIGLVQPEQNQVAIYAVHQLGERGPQKGTLLPMEGSAFKYVFETQLPFVCNDWQQETQFPSSRRQTEAIGVLSTIFLPLIWQDQVLGVLSLGHHLTNAYHDKDVDILIPIASQLAVAVKNMQLQDTIRDMATREEQLRLGREMHDGPGQVLGLIGMRIANVMDLLQQGQVQRARTAIGEIYKVTRSAYSEIRESVLGLRMAGSIGTELEPALRAYIEHYQFEWDIAIELTITDPTCLHMTPPVGNQVLRIIQEALTNIRQHARAQHVWMGITTEGGHMILTVKDDGCGFDPLEARPGHYGLQTMRERAEGIQGVLEITSGLGEGTLIHLRVPMGQVVRSET